MEHTGSCTKVSIVCPTLGGDKKKITDMLKDQTANVEIELLFVEGPGITDCMNEALGEATGEIFIRIDDDVEIPPSWLKELLKPFEEWSVIGATGPTFVPTFLRQNRDSIKFMELLLYVKPSAFVNWMLDGDPKAPAKIYKCGSVSYGSNFEEAIDMEKDYKIDHLEGTNWAVRTSYLKQVGGFDAKFGGEAEWFDDDALYRMFKKWPYMRIVYNPKAYLYHLLQPRSRLHGASLKTWCFVGNLLRWNIRHRSLWNFKLWIYVLLVCGYYVKRSLWKSA